MTQHIHTRTARLKSIFSLIVLLLLGVMASDLQAQTNAKIRRSTTKRTTVQKSGGAESQQRRTASPAITVTEEKRSTDTSLFEVNTTSGEVHEKVIRIGSASGTSYSRGGLNGADYAGFGGYIEASVDYPLHRNIGIQLTGSIEVKSVTARQGIVEASATLPYVGIGGAIRLDATSKVQISGGIRIQMAAGEGIFRLSTPQGTIEEQKPLANEAMVALTLGAGYRVRVSSLIEVVPHLSYHYFPTAAGTHGETLNTLRIGTAVMIDMR